MESECIRPNLQFDCSDNYVDFFPNQLDLWNLALTVFDLEIHDDGEWRRDDFNGGQLKELWNWVDNEVEI